MKLSMTGQEKCDLLIQVTAWAGLTAVIILILEVVMVMTIWQLDIQLPMQSVLISTESGQVYNIM